MGFSQAEFNQMVADHGPPLYRMAYRMVGDRHEAEDLVQETYRSVWKSRNSYQSGRSQRAWLVAILRRRVVDRWRRRRLPSVFSEEGVVQVSVEDADPLAKEYTDEMQLALNRLPKELRETLLLVVVGDLTHQEAANELRVPLGTVLSRVSRARNQLRQHMLETAK